MVRGCGAACGIDACAGAAHDMHHNTTHKDENMENGNMDLDMDMGMDMEDMGHEDGNGHYVAIGMDSGKDMNDEWRETPLWPWIWT